MAQTRIIVYEEPNVTWKQPSMNDWHLTALEVDRQLKLAGFEVYGEHEVTPDPSKDIAIYLDALLRPVHPPRHMKSLYISLEPPVVNNTRFYDRIKGWHYTRILTFARKYCDDKKIFWHPFPAIRYEKKEPVTRHPDAIVAISGNKWSDHPEHLYGVRVMLYKALGKRLHLYGNGWDALSNEVNVMGPCVSNFETFCSYKTAISIENQMLDGYCSEKWWTCVQAGCENIMRIGWQPDYKLDDCTPLAWGKRIVEHVNSIA